MTTIPTNKRFGPHSFTVSTFVDGGQLVMPDPVNPGMVMPAAANSALVLGVTLYPAEPDSYNPVSTPPYGTGFALDVSVPGSLTAVAWTGIFSLASTTAVNFGQKVCAGAAGAVQLAEATASTGRSVTDGVLTTGSTTVTSATGAFVAGDIGRTVTGTGIPAGTYITGVNSGTSVDISEAATATATGVSLAFGTLAAAAGPVVGQCVAPTGIAAGARGLIRLSL